MANVAVEKHRESGKLPETLLQKMNAIVDEIRQRAFSLFERRGGTNGSDFDDWLQAEKELLWSPASELIENKDDFRVRVALPGFEAKDLNITATPDAIVIRAESQHTHDGSDGDVHFCEFSGKEMFRHFDLPSEVDVDKITASLEKGMLDITAPKAKVKRLKVAA